MREEAPGPVAPPCPEEEDATLDPRAIGMTGIEAKVRAEGRAEVFGPERQKHINWANHHAGLSAGESRKLQDRGILWANHHASLSAGEAR